MKIKKPYQFKRIRARYSFWFMVISMLPLIVATTIIYQQRVSVIKSNQFQKLISIRDLKVRVLNQWIDEREADLKNFAMNSDLIVFADDLNTNETDVLSPAHREKALNTLSLFVDLYSAYQEIFIINATTGHVTLSSNSLSIGHDKRHFSYFSKPLESHGLVFTDIYLSPALGDTPGMVYSIPIRCDSHAGEHISAILVARIDLNSSLYPSLQDRTGFGQTGETLIVSREGYALNDLRHYPNAPLRLRITAEPAVNAAAGKTGITEIEDYRGEPVLAAYTNIPRTGWGFVSKQDQKEVYAPIIEMLSNLIVIILISALIVYVISYFISSTTVKPIMNMVAVAKRIGNQDYSARIQIQSVDETAILADYINSFTEATEQQFYFKDGLAQVNALLMGVEDLDGLAQNLILKLLDLTDSQLAGLYILNVESGQFEPYYSIGFHEEKLVSFRADRFEGEFGSVLSTKQVSRTSDIPEDTKYVFKSIVGNALPREIINIPIIVDFDVTAIISLASLKPFSDRIFKFIQELWIPLNSGFAKNLSQLEVQRIADELSQRNQDLESLAEEFKSQANELQEQNIELDNQRKQVEQANQLKSEFLSNMSHELRTPLNSILSLTGVLSKQVPDRLSEEEQNYLNIVERNGKQLLTLINDILDLSKIESGEMEIILTRISLSETVSNIVESLTPVARKKGLELKLKMDAEIPFIRSDNALLLRIIQNLLSNAIKFTEQGKVAVLLGVEGGTIKLEVKDTGIGIPTEKLSYIFEEFRQVDGSTSRKYEGTGLGLSIAKRSALLLGGDIKVKSIEGEGSTFTLILPLEINYYASQADGSTDRLQWNHEQRPTLTPKKENGSKTILIVEDQEPALILLSSYLVGAGYQIHSASNGQAAIEYCNESIPDGIVLDLMMPEVDGFQVLSSLRSDPKTSHIPVLILTAKDLTKQDLDQLRAFEVQQLIQKGDIDRQEFLEKINVLVGATSKSQSSTLPPEASLDKPRSSIRSVLNSDNLTLLIVEDNPDNMVAIKAILPPDYSILEATDGQTGLHLIASKRPDMVLMDIMVPVMDGVAILKEVRGDEGLKDIPIIAVSAKAMKGDRERYLAVGFDEFVSKPVDPDELREKVSSFISSDKE